LNNDLFNIIKEKMQLEEINITDYSPLTLAYIGDGIYEIVIRTIIVDEANRQVNKIHKAASGLVKAGTQAKMIHLIMDDLTEDEIQIFKRGRNAKAVTRAKNASMSEYRRATGFEALMGWLYLSGKSDRMMDLIMLALKRFEMEEKE
jgi:hypothetical protein